jgi:hypothetical protein
MLGTLSTRCHPVRVDDIQRSDALLKSPSCAEFAALQPERRPTMQQTRKPSFLKSIFGLKQTTKKSSRKAPTQIDERQLRQVAGGVNNESPKGGW